MGFLDNIENDLKALENREERDPAQIKRNQMQRESERSAAAAAAPYAQELRSGRFTTELLDHAVRIGHAVRTKVHITWLGSNLRLQARDRKLELEPTATGVYARFSEGDSETARELVDLKGDARGLAEKWLAGLGARAE